MPSLSASEVAARIDHTLLKPEATADDVRAVADEGRRLGVASVCVSPSMVATAVAAAGGTPVASVVGFPSGAHRADIKGVEAAAAVGDGAAEIDMVVNLGLVKAGDWEGVAADIAAVRHAVPTAVLKVIVEAGVLTTAELERITEVVAVSGAEFVKTSTGFHPTGGATVEAVATMARVAAGRIRVKASGGIRTADDALRMLDAGADRLGCSATAAILAGLGA